MCIIKTESIKQAVYKLCYEANTHLSKRAYEKILAAYSSASTPVAKAHFASILENAKIAYEARRPLCQDTGQVLVFLYIGQNVQIVGDDLVEAVNSAVEKCYCENYFRKSVVKDALFNRENTKTNVPSIVYTEMVSGDKIRIDVLIKGAGSENKSQAKMLLPTSSKEDVKKYVADCILASGMSSCPPLFVGVGIGASFDRAGVMAKQALVMENYQSEEHEQFANEIKELVNNSVSNELGENYLLDVSVKSAQTHIACLPVSVCINCHSSREASCEITENGILFLDEGYDFVDVKPSSLLDYVKIDSSEIEKIRNLNNGDDVLLSGEIYVARDAAHARLFEMIARGEKLPFEIKDKIIFYAGPCPKNPNEVIGPVGPTTSSRMDKFAPDLYSMGLLATIGKGERGHEVYKALKENNAIYFTMTGGVASSVSRCVESSEIIAFDDLGAEAIYKLKVNSMPLRVCLG